MTKQTRTQVPANVDRVIVNGEVKQVMTKSLEQKILDNAPELAYEYDDDSGCIMFFAGNEEIDEWFADDEIEACFDSFKAVYMAGYKKASEQIIALQNENAEKDKRIAELEQEVAINNKFHNQFVEVCRSGCLKIEGANAQEKLNTAFKDYVVELNELEEKRIAEDEEEQSD